MSLQELSRTIGTRKKLHGMIAYIMNVKRSVEDTRRLTKKWLPVAKENFELQKEWKKTEDHEKWARLNAKLCGDGAKISYDFTRVKQEFERELKEAKARNADVVVKEFAKVEKKGRKLKKRKKYDLDQLFNLVEFIGPSRVDELNKHLKGKTLKFKAEKFRIEQYLYRMEEPYMKIADIEQPVLLTRDSLKKALGHRVIRIRKGLVRQNDVPPEQVIQYIRNNRQAQSEKEILFRLRGLTVKVGDRAAKIDGLSLEHDLIHLKGFPKDVWAPLEHGRLRKAVATAMYVPRVKKALAESFEKDIEHVLKGVDAKGRPLTEDVYRQLKENYLGPLDWKVLDMMRNSLVVKSEEGIERARHRGVLPKKEEGRPDESRKAA